MKVLILNGSPHTNSTTWRALEEVSRTLNADGIESEFFHVSADTVGCLGCGYCKKSGTCVRNDAVCALAARLDEFDGIVVGSPTYYASPTGSLLSFMDRLFFSAGPKLRHKPAAAVAVARRAGTTNTFDDINKYFTINEMPVISSSYWNDVFGFNASDAEMDREGLQTMRNLAHNMAWILKAIDAGKQNGIMPPKSERGMATHFIR